MKNIFKMSLISLIITLCSVVSFAKEAYDLKKFQEAQKNGEKIILHFQADWCPVCQNQKPTLEVMQSEFDKNKIRFMTVSFDQEKDLVQKMQIPSPSTFVAFTGYKEVKKMPNQVSKQQMSDFINVAFNSKK